MAGMFSGDLEYLSNFSRHPVVYDGYVFPTVENAFQAAKTTDYHLRGSFVDMSPMAAKRAGRQLDLRPDWEQHKLQIMRKLLASKFVGNPSLIDKLVWLGDLLLVETNTWHDNEWGDCTCGRLACLPPGRNLLGTSLMWLRYYLAGGGS